MNFRRWVFFTLGIQALVVLLDKCAGLVLLVLLRDRPDLKGAADLLATLPFIMMAVANLGLATALVYHMRRKNFPAREVAQTTSMVALVWGGIVALLAILVSQFVLPLIQPHWKFSLAYVIPICLCVPFLLTASYFNSIQLALERIKQYNLVHLTASIAFLPLFFLFYWLCGSSVTEGIAFGRLATAALITIVTLIMHLWLEGQPDLGPDLSEPPDRPVPGGHPVPHRCCGTWRRPAGAEQAPTAAGGLLQPRGDLR
jgi:hypothetical protein